MKYIDLTSNEVIGKTINNLNGRPYRIVDNVSRKSSNNQNVAPVIALDLTNGDWERFYYDGKSDNPFYVSLNLFEEEPTPTKTIKMIVGRTYVTDGGVKVICEQLNPDNGFIRLFDQSFLPNTYKVKVLGYDFLGSTVLQGSWNVYEDGRAVAAAYQNVVDFYTPSNPKYYWVYVPNTSDGNNAGEPWKEITKWKGTGSGSISENNWTGFIDFNSRPSLYQSPQGYTLMQVAIQETRFNEEEFKFLSLSDGPAPVLPSAWTSPYGVLSISGWNLASSPIANLGITLNNSPVISAPIHTADKFFIAQVQYPFDVWVKSIDTLNCEFGYSDNGNTFTPVENSADAEFYWEYSLDGNSWTKHTSSFAKTTYPDELWSATKDYNVDNIVTYAGAKFKALQKINANPTGISFNQYKYIAVLNPLSLLGFSLIQLIDGACFIQKGLIFEHNGHNYMVMKDIPLNASTPAPSASSDLWLQLPASPVLDTVRWRREPSTAIEKIVKAKYLRLVLKPNASLIPSSPPTGTERRYFARLNSVEIKIVQA